MASERLLLPSTGSPATLLAVVFGFVSESSVSSGVSSTSYSNMCKSLTSIYDLWEKELSAIPLLSPVIEISSLLTIMSVCDLLIGSVASAIEVSASAPLRRLDREGAMFVKQPQTQVQGENEALYAALSPLDRLEIFSDGFQSRGGWKGSPR